MLGPDSLDELMQLVQGPVRTGLYRSSRKLKRTARSGKFVQFVQFEQQISFSLFCSQITMQSDWEPRPLDPDEALYDFTKGVARGTSLLEGTCAADTPVMVYQYMLRPIMECMDICLCTCGSLVAKWKCEVGAHLGLSCALRCLCACLLCVLHAR